jgi:small-conductance mechanosensitive channel
MNLSEIKNMLNLKPELIMNLGHAFINILIILMMCMVFLRIIHKLLQNFEKNRFLSSPFVILSHSVLRWLVYIGGLLLILQQTGISLNSVWTVISAIVAMIAIGFVAVWSVLSNLLCTVMLIIFHPFRIGDEIEIIDPAMTAGMEGKVKNINLMFTSLYEQSESGAVRGEIMIPNNLFFQKIIRCKKGNRTFSLDKQLFEEKSFLHSENSQHMKR